MTRREFFRRTVVLSISMPFVMDGYTCANRSEKKYKRFVASSVDHGIQSFPSPKRVPLGWKAFPVSPFSGENRTVLLFPDIKAEKPGTPVMLRITAAIDFREEKQVKACLPETGTTLGVFVMKYAHPFQPFEIAIDPKYLKEIAEEGIRLVLTEGTDDGWFFAPDPSMDDNLGLQPHLLVGSCEDVERSFIQNLYSMNSFSPFGWMGGSVQDALYELHLAGDTAATSTLHSHLDHYLNDEKGIIFENPYTVPMDGKFNSIEDFLPFACIAPLYPDHVSIENALRHLLKLKNEEGLIMDGRHITTEGCYTVAYPLAAIAEIRADAGLAQIALDQLIHRIRLLTDEAAIYQRATPEGSRSFRNWGRAVVWQLLGIVKTLRIIERNVFVKQEQNEFTRFAERRKRLTLVNDFGELRGIDAIKHSFIQGVELAVRHHDGEGMWHAYIDHHEYGVDTSTTAGIAASIAWGVKQGLLDPAYLPIARKAYRGLLNYVSPDGFLRNVSQINRGGEELQRSPYRVITQFGMGLMAQLKAALM